MRSYTDFNQARNEIRRDLNELGKTVFAGYQSMEISEEQREALTTKELQNYDYIVLNPVGAHLTPTQPWADAEWQDRLAGINGKPQNPGNAWLLRPDVWRPLIEENGLFSYTYAARLHWNRLLDIVKALRENSASRQCYVSVWDSHVDCSRLGYRRVPCSLGYHMMIRDDRMCMTYHMRSNDFATHWENDLWLALKLQTWFADQLEVPVGSLVHCVSSLHVYASEVAGVF